MNQSDVLNHLSVQYYDGQKINAFTGHMKKIWSMLNGDVNSEKKYSDVNLSGKNFEAIYYADNTSGVMGKDFSLCDFCQKIENKFGKSV